MRLLDLLMLAVLLAGTAAITYWLRGRRNLRQDAHDREMARREQIKADWAALKKRQNVE